MLLQSEDFGMFSKVKKLGICDYECVTHANSRVSGINGLLWVCAKYLA